MQNAMDLPFPRLTVDNQNASRQGWSAGLPVSLLLYLCLLLWLAVLSPLNAHASENSDAANTAVDIFVAAGNLAGLPITTDEAHIVKELLTCALSDRSGTDCAKNIVISTVLKQAGSNSPDVAAAANCLVDGGAPAGCIKDALISQLPQETRTLATCVIDGGNIADCTTKAALAQILPQVKGSLPPEALSAVTCVIGGKSLESCAKNAICPGSGAATQTCLADFLASKVSDPTAAATIKCMGKTGDQAQICMASLGEKALGGAAQHAQQAAVQQALATIAKLNVGAKETNPRDFPQQPAVLRNFTLVAEGIKDGDWSKILLGGGAQIASIASRIVLSIVLTPALANILGPVADMYIQNDVMAFQGAWAAMKRGDPVGVAQEAFTWYATTYIIPTCGLIPKGDFQDATCGSVAKAINWLADTASGAVKDVLGVGKDFLELIGLWDAVDNVATAIWDGVTSAIDALGNLLGGHKSKTIYICTTQPKDYFANNVLGACLGSATSRTIAGGAADTSKLVAACEGYYGQCTAYQNGVAHSACEKMADALSAVAGKASDALTKSAAEFTKVGAALFAGQIYKENRDMGVDPGPRDLCSPDFWLNMQSSYGSYCAAQIGKFFDANFRTTAPSFSCPIPTSASSVAQACVSALRSNSDKNLWVGPESVYCKKQRREDALNAALHPCDLSKRKKVDAGGKTIEIIEPNCKDIGGLGGVGLGYTPRIMNGDKTTMIPFRPGRDIGADITIFKNPNHTVLPPGLTPSQRFLIEASLTSVPVLPPAIGKRDTNIGKRDTNTGKRDTDAIKPGRPKARRKPANVPIVLNPRSGPGSGGFNLSKPGNSAMDRLGTLNTGAGISGVAGNSGGVSLQRPPQRAPVTARPAGNQGSGGINMVNGASGNSPVKRPATSSSRPTTSSSRPSPRQNQPNPIDYGGCSSCNTPRGPVVR